MEDNENRLENYVEDEDKQTLGDHLVNGIAYVKDVIQQTYDERLDFEAQKAYDAAIEKGIYNTIAALYEANVSDAEIIRVVCKFWNMSNNEALDRLIHEKRQAIYRSLDDYMLLQGYSKDYIRQFNIRNQTMLKLRKNPELLKLKNNPKKLMSLLQDD
ncbi:MAG: hypothetical protein LUH02_01445 [Erysipelotrichaceae bacterium]|nr:hypothetical protein [Erysipelotrichaceae bacterium]